MRTIIRIDERLLADAEQIALRTGRTLNSVIEDALRDGLARQTQAPKRTPSKLNTVAGKGLLPGVDLNNSAALLEVMSYP